jgi:hypothetical protein
VIALVTAVRAGAASGEATPRVLAATAGLSTGRGDAVKDLRVIVRVAVERVGLSGVTLGIASELARLVRAAATCVAVLAVATSADG